MLGYFCMVINWGFKSCFSETGHHFLIPTDDGCDHPTYGCVVLGKETIGQYSPKFSTNDLPLVVSPILLINYIISKLLICFLKQAYIYISQTVPNHGFSDSTWPTSWRVSCVSDSSELLEIGLQSKRLTDLTKSFANFVRPWRRVVRWWPHSWGWKTPKVTAPNSRWLKDPSVAVAFVG